MPKIKEFTDGMQVEGFFAIREASLRETRAGGQFIRMVLADSSGAIPANLWDGDEEAYRALSGAQIAKVRGTVESYRNSLQLKIGAIRPARPEEASAASFLAETPLDRESLLRELSALVSSISDNDYASLLHLIFDDAEMIDRMRIAPAAKEFHHAYVGGLLEHTVSVARICDSYARQNPALRRDLLLAGALLHDIGKLDEMRLAATVEYTDEGMLLGHLVQGTLFIEEKLRKLPDFPRVKRNLLIHLILSHHGQREYGSPVLPAIPEAFALHHVDNLDAKVFASGKFIADDNDPNRQWTERSMMLGTRMYKG